MRGVIALLAGVVIVAGALGADKDGTRYGIAPDLKAYPQGTPQEALASVLKAIDARRFDYLLAQLADPAFVDDRVRRLHGGRFEPQVEDTRTRLDPLTVKQLRRFLKDGTWTIRKDQAEVRLEKVPDHRVYLRRQGGRWFLEHRNRPENDRPAANGKE